MKGLFKNRKLTWLLVAYGIIQLSGLFIYNPLVLYGYEVCYLTAIFIGAIWVINKTKEERSFKTLGRTILLFFAINFGLFIIYIPTLLLNSSINWELDGGNESDPMILLAFFPAIHFIIAVTIIGLSGIVTRLTIKNEIKTTVPNTKL